MWLGKRHGLTITIQIKGLLENANIVEFQNYIDDKKEGAYRKVMDGAVPGDYTANYKRSGKRVIVA